MKHSGTEAPTTSPTNLVSERTFAASCQEALSPMATRNPSEEFSNAKAESRNAETTMTSSSSMGLIGSPAGDSRIPRPSPSSLRRSASMRLRGERVALNNLRHSSGSSILHQQYQQQRNPYNLNQQFSSKTTATSPITNNNNHHYQQHRQQIVEEFPVITENGTDSHRHRSFSLSLTPARPRRLHAASGKNYTGSMQQVDDSDVESVKSFGSACSTASACDHAHFALNGTTWSGRSRKYVVHCSNQNGDSENYLTPTQRAARQVRKFQNLLSEARKEIEEKDREILRLTKEVVELRLYKAALNSPDDRTDSSDALTVREANPFSPESPKDLPDESGFESSSVQSPLTPEKRRVDLLPGSLGDSGHFEEESVNSKDSNTNGKSGPEEMEKVSSSSEFLSNEKATTTTATKEIVENPCTEYLNDNLSSSNISAPFQARHTVAEDYERRILELEHKRVDELQELKEKHNDKVENLLFQLSELNTRYCEVRPSMDAAEARARDLEAELETTKKELAEHKAILEEQEERNKQMYVKMYAKGQEAARIEQADKIYEQATQTPPKVTMAEVLQQLNVTQAELENVKGTSYLSELQISAERSQCLLSAQEAVSLWVLATRKAMYRRIVESRNRQGALDPEITLQFLKSAIYYFLTDKENHHGHLNAIESILGFTDNEKLNIDKIYGSARK